MYNQSKPVRVKKPWQNEKQNKNQKRNAYISIICVFYASEAGNGELNIWRELKGVSNHLSWSPHMKWKKKHRLCMYMVIVVCARHHESDMKPGIQIISI